MSTAVVSHQCFIVQIKILMQKDSFFIIIFPMGSHAVTKLLSRRSGNVLFHKIHLMLGYVVSEHCSKNPAPCWGCLAKGALLSETQREIHCRAGEKENGARWNAPHWLMRWTQRKGLPTCSLASLGFSQQSLCGMQQVGFALAGSVHHPSEACITQLQTCVCCLSLLSLTFSALGKILTGCFLLFS